MMISAKTNISTRNRLLETVEQMMCTRGFARISTRDIARESKLAEGTLYNHFRNKEEIFIAVLERNVGAFRERLRDLPLRVARRTVRENLGEVAEEANRFYARVAPLLCSLFADVVMLENARRKLAELRMGPERSFEAIAAYLSAEKQIGRVAQTADTVATANTLLATAFGLAVLDHFLGRKLTKSQRRDRLATIVNTLMDGLAPR